MELGASVEGQRVAFFRKQVARWYCKHGRRFPWREPDASAFHVLLAEVLLQRTRAEAVAELYPELCSQFLDWSDVLKVEEGALRCMLRPLGLSNRRTTALRALARVMVERGRGVPTTRGELEEMPGVGQYIAAAVLTTVHGIREPMLDSNMVRVLERFFGPRTRADVRDDPYLQGLARMVVSLGSARRVNWGILDFGAGVCRPREPRCGECPVVAGCQWANGRGRASAASVRSPPPSTSCATSPLPSQDAPAIIHPHPDAP